MLAELDAVRKQNGELRLALLRIALSQPCLIASCSPQMPLCPAMMAKAAIAQHEPILRGY